MIISFDKCIIFSYKIKSLVFFIHTCFDLFGDKYLNRTFKRLLIFFKGFDV